MSNNNTNKKFNLSGPLAFAIALLVLAVFVPINLIAAYGDKVIDMTPSGKYTLSPITEKLLDDASDKKLDVYFLSELNDLQEVPRYLPLYHTLTELEKHDNITLHAQWTPNSFTLTFDENSVGTHANMPEDMEISYDSASDPLPSPKSPKIDGWEFLGWAAYDSEGGIGDEEENGQLNIGGGRRNAMKKAATRDASDSETDDPTSLMTVTYFAGDVIPAETVNSIIADVGDGGVYTLYAVWRKSLKTEFVDFSGGVQRTRTFTEEVYNGTSSSLLTAGITQGAHTGWTAAGWTMSRQKGALGSPLDSEIILSSDDNLFDMDAWAASASYAPHNSDGRQTLSYAAGGETLTSVGTMRDVASIHYSGSSLLSQNYNYIEVDPYKTYTLGVEYAGTASAQIGLGLFDENGAFIGQCWLFQGTDSGYGDPHRGGDHFGASTGLTDFRQEYVEFCPMTFEISYFNSLTEAQRASVRYVVLSFGNYSDDNTISTSNKTTVIYRNVTFTENRTYYGVYTQQAALTYDGNTTDTVTNMPLDPDPQNRVANSALGFGADDIFNPTFALSTNVPVRTGYTYQGWNTDPGATTGQTSGDVTIDADTVYYAIWAAHTYTITFNENGVGTSANMPSSITATYDAATGKLSSPTNTTVDGWTFRGWALDSSPSTVAYAAGTAIPAADVNSFYTADGATYTLYAVWEKTITATFIHYPAGTRTTDTVQKTVYNGASASIAANEIPTQGAYSGWTGEGWTTSQAKNATGSSVGALTLTADVTYYGVYTRQITLTYDQNTDDSTVSGMPTSPAAQTRRANSYLGFSSEDTVNPTFTVSSDVPTRTGYSFGGWGNTPSETVGSVTGEVELTESKTLYAVWALSDYTLTVAATVGGSVAGRYISGGNLANIAVAANGSEDYTIKFNYTISDLVPTAATGYTFDRWTAQGRTLTAAQQTSTNLSFNMPADNVTLTAEFTPNPYTITYHHASLSKTQNCTYDQNVTLFTNGDTETATQTAFSKTGYTFDCWNTSADGQGTPYAAGFVFQTPPNFVSTLNGNFDLYATWTQNAYNITYVLQGGSDDPSRPTSATFDDPAFSVSAPTKNGYIFTGWTVTGLDTTTAKWGTTVSADTALTSASTQCVNGESGSVYFKNLASTGGATVTLTATWTAKQYVLRYASGMSDNLEVVGGTYAYDENVTIAAASILGRTYPGWTFSTWTIGISTEGETRDPGDTFNLSALNPVFSELDLDSDKNPTVYMLAEWTAKNYCITYDTNGYAASAIVTGGRTNNWTWRDAESGDYLYKDGDTVVSLYGAYSDSTFGAGSYFYLNTGEQVRFGLGWSFTQGATEPDVDFLSDLTIEDIPDAALTAATAVQNEESLFCVKLYMVWSADYKAYEDEVALFQRTYMTYPASGNTTLRSETYANVADAVYTNAPQSARLPAVSAADSAYKPGGAEANEIWNNNTTAADYAQYAWVAGPIGNAQAWQSLPADSANDFTAATLTTVNGRIRPYLDMVIYDPCAQFAAGEIVSQTQETEDRILESAAQTLDGAVTDPQNSSLLTGLLLKEADLDYRLTSAEMLAINSTYGAACADGENDGLSYRPDEDTIEFLSEKFEEDLNEMYPDCENDENGRHHSFNSLIGAASGMIGKANEIFLLFGFDPEQPRDDSVDYFMDGTTMGFAVDSEGYVINPDCPYTTKSVYKLFDLIYGSPREGTYKSVVSGGLNTGNVALYYQVKDALGASAGVKLKKPSQQKLNSIVTTMAYAYHSLELEDADYTTFLTLFQEYFDATWGVKLREAGYTITSSNYLSSFSTYFDSASYNELSAFVNEYFSEPGVLKSTYVKRPAVEQNCIDGRSESWTRTFKNTSFSATGLDLSAFDFAEGTLCSLYCDKIDALVPTAADYSAVFRMIADNVQRADGETYMIDPRTNNTQALQNAFYPSTAQAVNTGSNYQTWWTDYAKSNAWGSTRADANNKPAYDTEWLYRYYTKTSVDALKSVIEGIAWNYDKLDQNRIDSMTNGAYNDGTICKALKDAIDGLTAKTFVIEFYRGLSDEIAEDHVDTLPYYYAGNVRKYYRFGDNVAYTTSADPDNSMDKTFVGWNTMPNTLGHNVSNSANRYMTDLDLDEVLLEQWWDPDDASASSAVVETDDSQTYTVKLYAEWVENVTLDIVMGGGDASVQVTLEGGSSFYATNDSGNHPTFDYGTTLTFGAPTRTGYQFDTWVFELGANNTASTFENSVYMFGYYTSRTKTNDTLTATWTPNTYTVTFNKNHADATGTMAAQTFRYDTAQTLTPNAFERPGFRLVAWTTNADGTGDSYTDAQSVLNLTTVQNGNVDLYAKWDYADFELEFVVGSDGVWNGWQGDAANADTQTKEITFAGLYNAADDDGKTWPIDPTGVVQVTDTLTIRSSFLGWYTQPSGGTRIDETVDHVESTDTQQKLYARFETEISTQTSNQVKIVLEQLNANDYTMASMKAVDAVLIDLLDNKFEATSTVLERLNTAKNALTEVTVDDATGGDATAPVVNVYENKAVLAAAISNRAFTADAEDLAYAQSEDTGEISYVMPGKAYYTYYCYTNSETPAIMVSAKDIAGASGRVSYPVTISMRDGDDDLNSKNQIRTRSGKVNSGWMNYTQDPTDPQAANYNPNRNADWTLGTNAVDNPYRNDLKYFGMDFSDGVFAGEKGYSYYTHEQYLLLKPTFETGAGKQYALYTFEVRDDSIGSLAPESAALAGAQSTTLASTDLTTTPNEDISPLRTVTIYVEYYNTMNGHDGDAGGQVVNASGTGTYNGSALEVYNAFHENGYQNNKWVNVDYLYRNAAGVANNEFIAPNFADDGTYSSYVANDPVYGQTDVGSFYYLMKEDDEGTTLYWNAYTQYIEENPNDTDVYQNARVAAAHAALEAVSDMVKTDMQKDAVREKMRSTPTQAAHVENGDYIYWPYTANTQWSTQFYAPARNERQALVYVHIYDRWGNTYTNILQRDLQDTKEGVAAALARGQVTINETGGSGIQGVTITELNTTKTVAVSGMTDDSAWNVVNNQFMITGLPEGKNNYQYTMTVTDNAGNDHTQNFRASSDGSVVVTVNDETMGGKYAAAAAAPLVETQSGGGSNGLRIGEIEVAALTTLAIEEVDPDEIKIDTIPDAQLNGDAAAEEERPDLYTFTLNEVYTVNLFADSQRDYTVSVKSTAGGILKTYVNGELSPAKSGKVLIPAGSQVQIRVSVKAGYELQSLAMLYPDGKTVNLVGAYNAEINDDVTIKAVFVETQALLRIYAHNGAVSGRQELFVSPYSRVSAVADPAPEGKVFAYWTQNGEDDVPVSYDEIYTFIATSSTELKAIYADAPAARTAGISMDAQSDTHVTVVNDMYTLSFSGRITVPEGAQIEEFGLLLTNRPADSCTAENFVIGGSVDGANVVKLVGQTLTNEGQCKINVNNVKAGQTRTGRLYLIVTLADGTTQTLYSNSWSELNTPAA